MGCEISKLDKDVCKHSETAKTHVNYIKKHGMKKYNEIMELDGRMPYDNIEEYQQGLVDKSIDNHSKSYNLGLVNLENSSESETTTANIYANMTWKQILELVVCCMILIYLIVKIKQFIKKRKNKKTISKSVKMSELVKNATSIPSAPPPPPPPPFPTNFTIAIPPKKMPVAPLAPLMNIIEETPAISFPNRLYD